MNALARGLILVGLVFLILGGAVYLASRFGVSLDRFPLGRLPGDIRIERGNFTCIFPLASMIVLSVVLSLLLNLILRLLNR